MACSSVRSCVSIRRATVTATSISTPLNAHSTYGIAGWPCPRPHAPCLPPRHASHAVPTLGVHSLPLDDVGGTVTGVTGVTGGAHHTAHSTGYLRSAGLLSAADFPRAAQLTIERGKELVASVIDDYQRGEVTTKTLQTFDEISDITCKVSDIGHFCQTTHWEPAWRSGAEEAASQILQYISELNTLDEIYHALCILCDRAEALGLTTEEIVVTKRLKLDMDVFGKHLPPASKKEVQSLQGELRALGTQYTEHHQHFESHVAVPSVKLTNYIQQRALPSTTEKTVTLAASNGQVFADVMRHVEDENVRRVVFEKHYANQANVQVLDKLVETRQTLARTLGTASYGHTAMALNMVTDPAEVAAFLCGLLNDTLPLAQQQHSLLQQTKKEYTGSDEPVMPWDVPYYMGALKENKQRIPTAHTRQYFTLANCIRGLSLLCDSLFGVEMRQTPLVRGEGWTGNDNEVQRFELIDRDSEDNERLVGVLYFDLFDRPGKMRLGATFPLVAGRQLGDPSQFQTPVAAVTMCLDGGLDVFQDTGAVTLTHSQTETLFHEFGHALHNLFSTCQYQFLAGSRCPMDFLEMPSTLFQKFAWDRRILQRFAVHPVTGAPIPDDMVHDFVAAKTMFHAFDFRAGLVESLYDVLLHGPPELRQQYLPQQQGVDIMDSHQLFCAVAAEHNLVPYPQECHRVGSFTHLVHYGSLYSTYVYGAAFSAQTFQQLFAADPLCRASGEKLRTELLCKGGTENPMDLMRAMLGQPLSTEALVEELTPID